MQSKQKEENKGKSGNQWIQQKKISKTKGGLRKKLIKLTNH